MIKISKSIIRQCAKNMMFDLTSDEVDTIFNEFDTVYAQVNFLSSIKGVDEVEPMTFPYKEHQHKLADDIPLKPLKRNLALKNSNTAFGNQIKLPKVVGVNSDVDE